MSAVARSCRCRRHRARAPRRRRRGAGGSSSSSSGSRSSRSRQRRSRAGRRRVLAEREHRVARGGDHDDALAATRSRPRRDRSRSIGDEIRRHRSMPSPMLMLITWAPWSAAQLMPVGDVVGRAGAVASSTRTGRIFAAGATPATPMPLLVAAAAMPATCVPWPFRSCAPGVHVSSAHEVRAGESLPAGPGGSGRRRCRRWR